MRYRGGTLGNQVDTGRIYNVMYFLLFSAWRKEWHALPVHVSVAVCTLVWAVRGDVWSSADLTQFVFCCLHKCVIWSCCWPVCQWGGRSCGFVCTNQHRCTEPSEPPEWHVRCLLCLVVPNEWSPCVVLCHCPWIVEEVAQPLTPWSYCNVCLGFLHIPTVHKTLVLVVHDDSLCRGNCNASFCSSAGDKDSFLIRAGSGENWDNLHVLPDDKHAFVVEVCCYLSSSSCVLIVNDAAQLVKDACCGFAAAWMIGPGSTQHQSAVVSFLEDRVHGFKGAIVVVSVDCVTSALQMI